MYLLKFTRQDGGVRGLKLVRGVTLIAKEASEQEPTLKL